MSKKISILVEPFEEKGKVKAYVIGEDWSSYEGDAEYDEYEDLNFMVGVNIAIKRALEKYNKRNKDHMDISEHYFVPDIMGKDLYTESYWLNDEIDRNLKKRGLVYKTKEEAIARAKEMLGIG